MLTRISAPLRTSTAKAAATKPPGETILHTYDFLRALPDYDRKLDEFLAPWKVERGFDKTCWHDLLLAEAARDAKAGRELFCAALSDCKNDLVLARIEAENKGKTDAARAKRRGRGQRQIRRAFGAVGERRRPAGRGGAAGRGRRVDAPL